MMMFLLFVILFLLLIGSIILIAQLGIAVQRLGLANSLLTQIIMFNSQNQYTERSRTEALHSFVTERDEFNGQ